MTKNEQNNIDNAVDCLNDVRNARETLEWAKERILELEDECDNFRDTVEAQKKEIEDLEKDMASLKD